jgi:hypothetical protein
LIGRARLASLNLFSKVLPKYVQKPRKQGR